MQAKGLTVYVQGQTSNREINTCPGASKSRVAPLKRITMPRLELMGGVNGARLESTLVRALHMDITQLKLWTHSMIVIPQVHTSAHK